MIGKIKIHIRLHVPEVFFLNIQSTFRLNEGLLIFGQMVPLLIGVGDPINREGIDLYFDSTLNCQAHVQVQVPCQVKVRSQVRSKRSKD